MFSLTFCVFDLLFRMPAVISVSELFFSFFFFFRLLIYDYEISVSRYATFVSD